MFLWLEIPLEPGDDGARGGQRAGRPARLSGPVLGGRAQPWQRMEAEKLVEPVALVFGFR